MRDKDKAVHHGKGVLTAVNNINEKLGPALVAKGFQVTEQNAIDNFMIELDGTENKCKSIFELWIFNDLFLATLGANAILGVSLAVCKAGAVHRGLPVS